MINLESLAATRLAEKPFPHVIVPHFVPLAALAAVRAALPAIGKRGSYPPGSLRLGAAARELVSDLEGPAMKAAIAAKLGVDLDDAPAMLTVRGWTGPQDGKIHTDSDAKRVTVLLYLNDAARFAANDGHLRLLRGPDDLEDFAAEIPPVDGTLLAFLNTANSWHGHKPFVGPRASMQLNYMTNDGRARYELRRHKISAVVKRLLPTA